MGIVARHLTYLWWKLQHMSDDEIKKFNDGFMKEEEMSDDRITVNLSGITKEQTSELARMTAKQIYTQGYVAGELVTQIETWNAAIEAAAEVCKYSGYAEQIRNLKK